MNRLEPLSADDVVALVGIATETDTIAGYIDTLAMRAHRLGVERLPLAALDGSQLAEFRKLIGDVLVDLGTAYKDLEEIAVAVGVRQPQRVG